LHPRIEFLAKNRANIFRVVESGSGIVGKHDESLRDEFDVNEAISIPRNFLSARLKICVIHGGLDESLVKMGRERQIFPGLYASGRDSHRLHEPR
jgi:hypothetical protein